MYKNIEKKIQDLKSIEIISKKLRQERKKIILCHGDFDLLHTGHLNYFLEAKKRGDVLIVSVTSEKFIKKGPGRPVNNDQQRINFLAHIQIIDYVILSKNYNSVKIIKTIKPNLYVKGKDYYSSKKNRYYSNNLKLEKTAVQKYGGNLIFTKNQTRSSSNIINANLLDKSIIDKIQKIKKSYNYEKFLVDIERLKNLKILVIGETIIDEYIYTSPLGKPSKENIIATEFLRKEISLGGIFTAYSTFKSFSNNVDCITTISNKNRKLFKNIFKNIKNKKLILEANSDTTKIRFVDNSHKTIKKLFEIYKNSFNKNSEKNLKFICKYLEQKLHLYDLVLVNDYGHGFFADKIIKLLERNSKFLATNVQINAGNKGLNLITKYKRSDFACVDEMEAMRVAGSLNLNTNDLLSKLHKKINSKSICITLGSKGSCIKNKNETSIFSPALTNSVVDTIGAGDIFFVVASIFLNIKKSNEIASFLGNVGGAIAVNKENSNISSIKESFMSYVETLLK